MSGKITYRPAVRAGTPLLIGLGGPSWSGKTKSALRLATGIAGGGPIFGLDTESGRMSHYADEFKFMHAELTAPFRPERYLAGLMEAKEAGAAVCIVDSMSHEHEGPGGILEWHEEELERMAGSDWAKRERVKFTAWIKPKQAHNKLVNAVLQIGMHCIFCFRAKDKLVMVKNDQGKNEPVSVGWTPICADRFEYEMTMQLILPPNSRGVPDLKAASTKLQDQHRPFLKEGQQIDEALGQRLADWAKGSAASKEGGKISTGPKDLPLKDGAGNTVSVYERAGAWLDAFEKALKAAGQGDLAGKLWDQNNDVFYAIQAKAKQPASQARCNAVGKLAAELMNGQQQQGRMI